MPDQPRSAQAPWLLLIHRLPPEPGYLRVKDRRRLQRIGARLVKNSVYVLPFGEEALEDLQWLARDIAADGGEAMVCEASFVASVGNEEVAALFDLGMAPAAPARAPGPERVEPGRVWVTRQDVFVDRIASAWLIRRFVDPEPRFKFVAPREALPADAIAFGFGVASLNRHREAATRAGLPLVVGGRSLGARVACRTVERTGGDAVLCLAFPLIPPRRGEKPPESRLPELEAVKVPVLVGQGESDRFGMPPESPTRRVARVAGDHGLKADTDAVATVVRQWLANLPLPAGARSR